MNNTIIRSTTVAEAWQEYEHDVFIDISPRTAITYDVGMRVRVLPSLGTIPLVTLSRRHIRAAYAAWTGAESTKRDALSALSRLLNVCIDEGLISTNPCHRLGLKRRESSRPTSRALTPDQVQTLIEQVPPGPYRRLLLALIFTGARYGEIIALTPANIDLTAGLITITNSLSPGEKGALVLGPTKTHRQRVIPIPAPLHPVLVEAMAGKQPGEYLFTGPRGGLITSGNFTRAIHFHEWRDSIKAYATGVGLRIYDLRHTALTLLAQEAALFDVQYVAGHSNITTTQRYARSDEAAAYRIGETWSGIIPQIEGTKKHAQHE